MKTATSPDQAAPKRTRTRRATAEKPRKRRTETPPRPTATDDDFTPEQLEDSLEGEVALPTAGMHGEEFDDESIDPDTFEEVAELETATAGEPPVEAESPAEVVELEDAVADSDGDDEEVEPDLGALLTGMLVPEPEPGVDDDDDEQGLLGLEIEYVPTARGNEFVCTACFLIWNRRHLADAERRLCRDCIDDVAPAPPGVAA